MPALNQEQSSPTRTIPPRAVAPILDRVFMLLPPIAFIVAFIPTYIKLINGPWRTEQEGHGPLIIAAAAWLAFQARHQLKTTPTSAAPLTGWLTLLLGLAAMVVSRSQDVTIVEVASQMPIIAGYVLMVGGWQALKIFAFPIVFLTFSIPPPGWMLDSLTVPLKSKVSDWVTDLLYFFDYPIAQNGVAIMIGKYQVMVKDACSGMNSIFALSAIGIFYVHEFVRGSILRPLILIISIIPITIAANFVRVIALVLIVYYFGVDAIEGIYHDLTGFALFGVALGLFLFLDAFLIGIFSLARRLMHLRSKPSHALALAGSEKGRQQVP